MKIPTQSYRIWFSQRNGSTLLCKMLELTGIAGAPGEFFNVMENESLCEKYQVSTYEGLKHAIWSAGTRENGVFGMKHSMHRTRYEKIYVELKRLRNIPSDQVISEEELLGPFFPNCKHIFLTRRNKIRQAVSWWKAIQDNNWHMKPEDTYAAAPGFYENKYDYEAIKHLFQEASLRECAMQDYFSKFRINPLTLVYEDMVTDMKGTVLQVLDYLNISGDPVFGENYYQPTANEQSEIWVQRFRKDLQSEMGHQIW